MLLATTMRTATAAGGDAATRVAYIAAHAGAVRAGWYLWELATLSLVAVFVTVLRSVDAAPGLRLLSFAAVCMGAIPDSINNVVNAAIVPEIAKAVAAGAAPMIEFRAWDRFSVVLTGGLANGLYALAGWLLMAATAREPRFPRALVALQWPLWLATTAMSASAFAESIPGLEVSVGVTMATFVVWTFAVGWRWLGRAE